MSEGGFFPDSTDWTPKVKISFFSLFFFFIFIFHLTYSRYRIILKRGRREKS